MIHKIETWFDGTGRSVHEMVPLDGEEIPTDFKPFFCELVLTAQTPQGQIPVRTEQCFLDAFTVKEAFVVHDATAQAEMPKMIERASQGRARQTEQQDRGPKPDRHRQNAQRASARREPIEAAQVSAKYIGGRIGNEYWRRYWDKVDDCWGILIRWPMSEGPEPPPIDLNQPIDWKNYVATYETK